MIRKELTIRLASLEREIETALRNSPQRLFISDAERHARNVAATVLFGEPEITEPFERASRRMYERLFGLIRHKELSPQVAHVYPFVFFESYSAMRFEKILQRMAPPWLLKFTGTHWDATILKITLPDLSGAPELGKEARIDRDRWPGLPLGTIDAGGPAGEPEEAIATTIQYLKRDYWGARRRFLASDYCDMSMFEPPPPDWDIDEAPEE
jgi:hypothetical protein